VHAVEIMTLVGVGALCEPVDPFDDRRGSPITCVDIGLFDDGRIGG